MSHFINKIFTWWPLLRYESTCLRTIRFLLLSTLQTSQKPKQKSGQEERASVAAFLAALLGPLLAGLGPGLRGWGARRVPGGEHDCVEAVGQPVVAVAPEEPTRLEDIVVSLLCLFGKACQSALSKPLLTSHHAPPLRKARPRPALPPTPRHGTTPPPGEATEGEDSGACFSLRRRQIARLFLGLDLPRSEPLTKPSTSNPPHEELVHGGDLCPEVGGGQGTPNRGALHEGLVRLADKAEAEEGVIVDVGQGALENIWSKCRKEKKTRSGGRRSFVRPGPKNR